MTSDLEPLELREHPCWLSCRVWVTLSKDTNVAPPRTVVTTQGPHRVKCSLWVRSEGQWTAWLLDSVSRWRPHRSHPLPAPAPGTLGTSPLRALLQAGPMLRALPMRRDAKPRDRLSLTFPSQSAALGGRPVVLREVLGFLPEETLSSEFFSSSFSDFIKL